MAISPNVDFVAGNILTAAQQNQFPRGIVALTTSTSSSGTITSEVATLTSSSFTAVANRYYKITYYEPILQVSGTPPGYLSARIRLTNVSGTIYQLADFEPVINTGSDGMIMTLSAVTTLTAGATTICGTLQANSNSVVAFGNASVRRFILVEDLGPA
jgi:hypothetical protein